MYIMRKELNIKRRGVLMGRPGPKKRVHNVFGCIDANSLKPPLLHPSHQKHSFAPRSLTSFHLYTLFSLVHSHSSPYALIFYLSSSTLFKITESLSLLLLLSICMAILPLLSCFFYILRILRLDCHQVAPDN